MDDQRARHDYHWEMCLICGCARERRVDRQLGEYHVMLPSQCATKNECEQQLMRGYEFVRHKAT